jgi:hypothetical protein
MPGDGQGISVPLSLFSGMCTELAPASLPDGVSPDCQDVVFLPGSVASRPGLEKFFNTPFTNGFGPPFAPNPTVYWAKTFVQANGNPLNLYEDSDNTLWIEDVINNPGVATAFGSGFTPGAQTCAVSATQFGREYITYSDGRHGTTVPLQFDGTYFDRVTQDGPGAPPQVADFNTSYALAASPNGAQMVMSAVAITAYSQSDYVSSVTVSGAGFNGNLRVGDAIQVSGTGTGYDGTWVVSAVTFRLGSPGSTTISYVNTQTGLPGGSGGTISSQVAQFTTAAANPLAVNQQITVSGAGVSGYNGNWQIRTVVSSTVFIAAIASFSLAASGGGNVSIAGSVAAGTHRFCVLFLTRQGYITKPSPTSAWISGGNTSCHVTQIPIGPSNVIARIIAFTASGGGNYFYIPTQIAIQNPNALPTIISSTVIPDNTTTAVTLNFSDSALLAATAIDIPGRNYFAQVVLAECAGVFPYASRIVWWGERNKVQNLLNMGFEGGYISHFTGIPCGWNFISSGGTLITGGAWPAGMCWIITGDGSTNNLGQLSQSAYQDQLGIAITQPNTAYLFRCYLRVGPTVPVSGSFVAQLASASTGFTATATFQLNSVSLPGQFYQANFSAPTPAVIPADLTLSIFEQGLPSGATVVVDECQLVPAANPYRDNVFRVSYVNAPEQMDGVTGVMGSASDSSPIRNCFQLRNTLYFHTANGLSYTNDNGTGEPASWNVAEVTQAVGSCSLHGTDAGKVGSGESGEQIQFTANESGVYVFSGGETFKISQEIQSPAANGAPGWDSINKAAIQTLWVKNDITNRRLYIGAPTGTALSPNVLFVLDYRELNDFNAIALNGPYRQSLQGRLIAVEFCRKWTRWSVTANYGEILARPNQTQQFALCGGNGEAIGSGSGFGNVYQLSSAKLTDDDYGPIVPYYTTYFFCTRDQEQAFGLGAHRKLATYLSAFLAGTGLSAITPLADSLANPWPALPAYPLMASPAHEQEWGLNVDGERIAIKIGSVPASGSTDNSFNLEHLALTLKKHPIASVRGAL